MRIRRDIASVPARSAKDTWRAIIDLATGADSIDRQQLDAAASVMESLIADALPADAPIVFKGSGPRLLIYCLYHEEAIEAGLEIDPLSANPTAGDWRVTAPCEDDDVAWMNKTLKARAPRISVHAADEEPVEGEDAEGQEQSKSFEIDWGAVRKP